MSEKTRKRRGRGEGGVRYSQTHQCWIGCLSLGYTASGRRRRRYVYGATKREVLDSLDRLRAEKAGGVIADASLSVAGLLQRWLDGGTTRLAPATHESRTTSVRLHLVPRIGHLKLAKLTPLDVEGFYGQMARDGVGPFAIHYAAACLIATLRHAVRLRLIAASPADMVPGPVRPHREMNFLTATQVRILLDAARPWPCYPLFALALATGCRQGELLGLHWPDVDLAGSRLHVRRTLCRTKKGFLLKEPKTPASRRTLALPAAAVDLLASRRRAQESAGRLDAPVFCSKSGGFLWRRNTLRSLHAVIDRVNDPDRNRKGGRPRQGVLRPANTRREVIPDGLRFHDLRHTVASLLLSAGCSLRAVSARLGHSSPAFTLRVYGHVMPGDDLALADQIGRQIF